MLIGDSQANFLVSRGGADRVTALGGPDTIDTLDNGTTRPAGPGTDCAIDAGDVRSSCETVFPLIPQPEKAGSAVLAGSLRFPSRSPAVGIPL